MKGGVTIATLLLAAGAVLAADPTANDRTGADATTPARTDDVRRADHGAADPDPEARPGGLTDGRAAEAGSAGAANEREVEAGPKTISGMSVLGNQEAPTSLVIVPWKSSRLGDSMGITAMLDDARQPVDREVFLRALRYYEIRSEPAR